MQQFSYKEKNHFELDRTVFFQEKKNRENRKKPEQYKSKI
jgi:hypothetical protein